jgi:hypothetical protein
VGIAQAALARPLVARQQPLAAPPFCAPQVKLLDRSSPFTSKANVVAYYRHVPFASDDPADAARHRAPGPIGTTRIEEAFVHELPEEFVGSVFAQADLVAYERDLGVWVYLVSPALALLDSREHLSALVVGKLCRHYAPLPLVPPPIVRLPDRTATCPRRRVGDGAIFEVRQVCSKNRPFGGCVAPREVVALSATTPHKSVEKGVQEMQFLQIEQRISIEQVAHAFLEKYL